MARSAAARTYLLAGVEPGPLGEIPTEPATLLDEVLAKHGGLATPGRAEDAGGLYEFGSPSAAAQAAVMAHAAVAGESWPDGRTIRVRVGVDTGAAGGPATADRCRRLRDVAHGGQTIVSAATATFLADALPVGSWLVDLGVHRLRDLTRPEHLFELCHEDLPHDFAPVRSLSVLPNNLPIQLTSFVGRGAELDEVERRLTARRVVTLAGAGGCGKTRLAAQAAARLVDRWPDGVWWIDLDAVTDPALVASVTAATMRALVEPVGGALAALRSQLRDKNLLICLDTCEHVLDAAAELVDTLVRSCPMVSVLATSREPLGVAGEAVWRVPSLVLNEAAGLFTDRAALVSQEVDAADETVRTICRRLDGIPLAIELAAAWLRALPLAQIAAGLDDRFRLLVGGPRGIARQQTLSASIEWSHDLLDEADRVVFRRLAVFAGGFTLDAASAVCGPDQDTLSVAGRLIDKSLVAAGDDGRYRMLETVRQYGADRLRAAGETEAVRDRHLDYFLTMAEEGESGLERDQDRWRQLLDNDNDNLRGALQWGLDLPDPRRGRRLAAALARFWVIRGHAREGLGFLRRAAELAPDDRSELAASLLSGTAMVAMVGGRLELTAESARRGLELATTNDDARNLGRCLLMSAYLPFYFDFAEADRLCAQTRQHAEASDDLFTGDFALLLRACTLTNRDLHAEAVPLARAVFDRCMPRGDRFCAAFARSVEVWAALFTGDLRHADALGTQAVGIAEPLDDYFTVGTNTTNLAWARGLAGDVDGGLALMADVVRSLSDAGPDVDVVGMVVMLGKLHLWAGDLDGALRWFERGTRFAAPATENWIVARSLPGLASTLRRLGRPDEARPHAERAILLARKLNIPHVTAEGLEELAFLVTDEAPERAEDLHHEALAVRIDHGLRTFQVDSLEALAGLAARSGGHAEAAHLLGACDSARDLTGYRRPPIAQPDHDATVDAARAALGADGFKDARLDGALLSLEDAIRYARRARGARNRPTSGWASLTPTELDVVRLAVQGLTNPQIGARLFISVATVKTHLRHVYAKLGVANRTELATLAGPRLAEG